MVSVGTSCYCGYSAAVKNLRRYIVHLAHNKNRDDRRTSALPPHFSIPVSLPVRMDISASSPTSFGLPSSCFVHPDHTYRSFFGVSSQVFFADHCSRVVTVLSDTLGVDRERISHLMRLGMTVVKECLGHSRKCGRLAVVSFRVSKAFSK